MIVGQVTSLVVYSYVRVYSYLIWWDKGPSLPVVNKCTGD